MSVVISVFLCSFYFTSVTLYLQCCQADIWCCRWTVYSCKSEAWWQLAQA